MADLQVLGLAGSLRSGSYNRTLLRAAADLAPAGMAIRAWEGLRDVPLYDGDVEARGLPAGVEAMREAVQGAGAVLVVTPEYNHSIPGVLKNALDWASRPPGRSAFAGKVVAITGASPGPMGTVRAQMDLRRVLATLGAFVVPSPEVLVASVSQKLDAEGRLVDEATRKYLGRLLAALASWHARMAGATGA
jgi:chromate reductase